MKVLHDIAWKGLAALSPTLAWVLLAPAIIGTLGAERFGLFAFVFGMIAMLNLLSVGFVPALAREAAPLVRRGDTAGTSLAASRAFLFLTSSGLLAATFFLFVGAAGRHVFDFGTAGPALVAQLTLLGAGYVLLAFPLSTYQAMMDALQAFRTDAVIRISQATAFLASGLTILDRGGELPALAAAFFITALAAALLRALHVHRSIPGLRIRPRWRRDNGTGRFLGDTVTMGLWSISGSVVHGMDRLLVAVFAPVAAVGVYDLGARVNDASRMALFGGLPAVLPKAATAPDRGALLGVQVLVSKLLLASIVAVLLWLLAFGDMFMLLWIGPGFEQAISVAILLLLATAFQAQHVVGHFVLAGLGVMAPLRNASIAAPVLNIFLNVLLGFYYGLLGIASATLLTTLVTESYLFAAVRRTLGIRLTDYLRDVHLRVAVGAAVGLVAWTAAGGLAPLEDPRGWGHLLASTAAAAVLFLAVLLLAVLDGGDRQMLRAWMTRGNAPPVQTWRRS